MSNRELILCRVILRRMASGEIFDEIMQDYQLISADSAERIKAYVED